MCATLTNNEFINLADVDSTAIVFSQCEVTIAVQIS